MDYQLQYFIPKGFIGAPPGFKQEIMDLGASLVGADSAEGVAIPNTPLTIRMMLMLNGAGIDFKYKGQQSYVNFCCFEKRHSDSIFKIVRSEYKEYNLGEPQKPTLPQWIHLIPVGGEMPSVKHSLLSQELTVAFYWAAFAQLTRGKAMRK